MIKICKIENDFRLKFGCLDWPLEVDLISTATVTSDRLG